MDFLRRAALYLKVKSGKSVILLAIILAVCVTVLSGFGIVSASQNASILARQKLGADVILQLDMQKMREKAMAEMQNNTSNNNVGGRVQIVREPVPLTYLEELEKSEYVESYEINSSTTVSAEGFNAVESEESTNNNVNSNTNINTNQNLPNKDGMPTGDRMPLNNGDITLNGVNVSSNIEIVEGVGITDDNLSEDVAVIEKNLAEENSLKVGDKIKVKSSKDDTIIKELTIIGVYTSAEEFSDMAFRNNAQIPYNKIYVPYKVANYFKGDTYSNAVDKIVFNINDPVNVDKFIEYGNSTSVDFDKFTLDANNAEYEAMVGPIENVASFSKTALVIIAIFGAAILALIIMLSLKDRISEIGILLSLGEGKVKIIAQLLSEVLIVLVIALGVSVLAGGPISNAISNKLVQNEIATTEQQVQEGGFGLQGGPGGQGGNRGGFNPFSRNPNVEAINELNVNITGAEFGKMSLVALLISIVATIIPSTFIMRLNPKNILSKQ